MSKAKRFPFYDFGIGRLQPGNPSAATRHLLQRGRCIAVFPAAPFPLFCMTALCTYPHAGPRIIDAILALGKRRGFFFYFVPSFPPLPAKWRGAFLT